jgi:hypothetical protein
LIRQKIKRLIPDSETVTYFNYNPDNLTTINDEEIASFKDGAPVKSLITSRHKTADERMRNYVQTILAVHEPTFWKGEYFVSGICNPSLAYIGSRKDFLLSWHCFDGANDIKFGWLSLNESNFSYSNESLSEDLGLSPYTKFPIHVKEFNYYQHDPRILVENDTSFIVSYGVHLGQFPNGVSKQCLVKANIVGNKTIFEESILMDYPGGQDQKNWIPFYSEKRLLFIQSISPFHVVELVGEEIQTVVKNNETDIPWKGWHGWPLRGGTPAILVRGVYLSFFHVCFMFQFPYKLRSYFMGALTFCPKPPFHFHSMSSHPIIKEHLYDGPWVNIKVDYVIFPTGITLDPDGKHLWLSFGWQDIHGKIVKIDIDELMASLTKINEC